MKKPAARDGVKGGEEMKEVYLTVAEAARDLRIEAKVIRFLMQKGLVKSGKMLPTPGGKQRKYVIYTRQLCKELGIPFAESNSSNIKEE